MFTLTYTLLSLTPAVLGLLAYLVGAIVAALTPVRAPKSAHDSTDAQDWCDALASELDVDAEWCRMSDDAVEADMVETMWDTVITAAHSRLDAEAKASGTREVARTLPKRAHIKKRAARLAKHVHMVQCRAV